MARAHLASVGLSGGVRAGLRECGAETSGNGKFH
jgi:hypothetical protein